MTEQEFEERQEDILKSVPEEYRKGVAAYAWEQGHSCGRYEVIGYLQDIVFIIFGRNSLDSKGNR